MPVRRFLVFAALFADCRSIEQIHYFVLACVTCCYGSRTIRLAVMYNARARNAVPWLMSVRLLPPARVVRYFASAAHAALRGMRYTVRPLSAKAKEARATQ